MIKIIDKSEVKDENNICIIKNDEVVQKINIEKKNKINFIAKDKMMRCERSSRFGLTNNCAICQNLNSVIFEKCQNKWI